VLAGDGTGGSPVGMHSAAPSSATAEAFSVEQASGGTGWLGQDAIPNGLE
jgi:hypothetical protein